MRTEEVPAIILSKGMGQELFPRNKQHANPAMLFDGPYAPIDSGLRNTIDAGIQRIPVIMQHNSTSLGEHIKFGWDVFFFQSGNQYYPSSSQTGRKCK